METRRVIVILVLILLAAVSQVQGATVVIHVLYEGASTYIKSVTFTGPLYAQFHHCLCVDVSKTCTARFSNAGASLNANSVQSTRKSPSDGLLSSFYTCTVTTSDERLLCRRLPVPTESCNTTAHSTSFQLRSSRTCTFNCVGIVWKYSEENIYNSQGNLLILDACDDHCYGKYETTTLSPTSIKTATSSEFTPPSSSASLTSIAPPATSTPSSVRTSENPTRPTTTATRTSQTPTEMTTTTSTITTSGNDTSTPKANAQVSDDNIGIIVGVVIGVVLVVIFILIIIIILRRRSKRNSPKMINQSGGSSLPYINQSDLNITNTCSETGNYELARQPESDVSYINNPSADIVMANSSKPSIGSRFSAVIASLRNRLRRKKHAELPDRRGQQDAVADSNHPDQMNTEYDYAMFSNYENVNSEQDSSSGNLQNSFSNAQGSAEYGYSVIDPGYFIGPYTNVSDGNAVPKNNGSNGNNMDDDGYERPRESSTSSAIAGYTHNGDTANAQSAPNREATDDNQYSDIEEDNNHSQQTQINPTPMSVYSSLGDKVRTIIHPYNDLTHPITQAGEGHPSGKLLPSPQMTNQESYYSVAGPITAHPGHFADSSVDPAYSVSRFHGSRSTHPKKNTPESSVCELGKFNTGNTMANSHDGQHFYLELLDEDDKGTQVNDDEKHMYFELEKEEELEDNVSEIDL